VKINMLPSSWKDLLQKGQCFGIFARLIFVQEARKDSRVVIDYHICNRATALIAVALYLNRRLWPFTAFKSWITSERSLRFKYSATSGAIPRDREVSAVLEGASKMS
jgi:hypothetical protein